MAGLQLYSFGQMVSNIATAIQGSATALFNFKVGSALRAIAEAVSALTLWLQAIVLQLLKTTRAATSIEADLDSFMADFGVFREESVPATGAVSFSRFTSAMQALVPVGATVQTSDGSQNFSVEQDLSNPNFNSLLNGYIIAANTGSVTVPVKAVAAGAGGNVQANTISVITTPIPGVDTATNGAALVNGLDAETDIALRSRFVLYLSSLSKGTKIAIQYAISSVQQGLQSSIRENEDYNGTLDYGFFTVIVDDGSGTPSSPLLARVSAAIEAVRALTTRYGVFPPTVLTANVEMTITSAPGFVHADVVGAVGVAFQKFIGTLLLGASLPFTQLPAIAYAVSGVKNVSDVLLNGGTDDLVATYKNVIKPGTITVA